MNDTSFQQRVENTLAAILEGISEFQKSMEARMDRLEERVERLESIVQQMKVEAAEDRARMDATRISILKSARELLAV